MAKLAIGNGQSSVRKALLKWKRVWAWLPATVCGSAGKPSMAAAAFAAVVSAAQVAGRVRASAGNTDEGAF